MISAAKAYKFELKKDIIFRPGEHADIDLFILIFQK